MPTDRTQHAHLVHLGAQWLRKNGFAVVATEITAAGSREQPDVIGFRSQCSVIIEAKASRADFLADRRKPERAADGGGLGLYRFYLCPADIIEPNDLPSKWGLLHARGQAVRMVHGPLGNIWPAAGSQTGNWREFQHEPSARAERAVLFSIARRLSQRSPAAFERQDANPGLAQRQTTGDTR